MSRHPRTRDLRSGATAYNHRNNRRVSEGKLQCRRGDLDIKGVANLAQPLDFLDNIIWGIPIVELAMAALMGNQNAGVERPSDNDANLPAFTERE